MNTVILTGRLTRDVELLNTQGGTGYLRNALAVKSDFKNANGEYPTNFFNFCAFGKTAEIISKYCGKGTLILVKGHLTNNTINNDKGQACTIIELIVDNVELIESKKQQETQPSNNVYANNSYYNSNNSQKQQFEQAFEESKNQFNLSPDDLPF